MKKLIYIFVLLLLISCIHADDTELQIICGGDNELQIGCSFGDIELSNILIIQENEITPVVSTSSGTQFIHGNEESPETRPCPDGYKATRTESGELLCVPLIEKMNYLDAFIESSGKIISKINPQLGFVIIIIAVLVLILTVNEVLRRKKNERHNKMGNQ